jgi:hypothetical protein
VHVVKRQFISCPKKHKHGRRHANGQTGQIEQRVEPVAPEQTNGSFEEVLKHSLISGKSCCPEVAIICAIGNLL